MESTLTKKELTPTEEQFKALTGAFKYFNVRLFNGKLPSCILNFSRKKNTHGFLAPSRWRRVDSVDEYIHEISLTPYTFYREPRLVFSTLVHEMVHLWQWEFGSPSRNGYHNREWAKKMEEVGLIPSNTGQEGGKKTGQSMTHYIDPSGKYHTLFDKIPSALLLPFTSIEGDIIKRMIDSKSNRNGSDKNNTESKLDKRNRLISSGRKKTKYNCSSCNLNVWGRPNLELKCLKCDQPLSVV